MPATIADLGKKVKAKYPGTYDDLSDDQVGQKVKAKFPGAYDDFVDDPNAAIKAQQAAQFPTSAEAGGKPGQAVDAQAPSIPFVDTAVGAVKGAAGSAYNLARMTGLVPDVDPDVLRPSNPEQAVGKGAEQVGEYFLPAAKVGQAAKGLQTGSRAVNALVRGGLEAGSAAAVTGAQTRGDPGSMATAAAVGGAIPIAGEALSAGTAPLRKFLSAKVPPRLINNLIKPSKSQKTFGREPGAEVARQGIRANSLQDLQKKVVARKEEIGAKIDQFLTHPKAAAQQIDVAPLVNGPIDAAIKKAKIDGNGGLVTRLEGLRKGQLMEQFGLNVTPKALRLNPLDARKVKTALGKSFKWSPDVIEGTINDVKQDIYRNLNNAIGEKVPGVKQLNRQYSNLLSAEKAAENRVQALDNMNFVGASDAVASMMFTFGSAAMTGDVGTSALIGVLGAAARKGMKSTAFVTRAASGLAKLAPEEKALAFQFQKLAPKQQKAVAERVLPFLKNLSLAESHQ